jgi:outer membrane protein OmpA-like peptidoglycan-associated protein
MKRFLVLIFVLTNYCFYFGINQLPVYLLSKNQFRDLESTNKVMEAAITNAFGVANEDNYYKISIKKADATYGALGEFRYFPDVDAEKKIKLGKLISASTKIESFKIKVHINDEKSILNNRVRAYIDENSSFEITIVVLADERIFVTEAISKDVFNETVNELSFVDKAFKNFFGANVMNMNYHIEVLKTSACIIKDPTKTDCLDQFNVDKTDSVKNIMSKKITSKGYSSAFILFDVTVSKEKSRLTPKANEVIIKDPDRSEHIRFYFCIPKDNLRPGSGRHFDIEGKIVSIDKKPLSDITVELRDVDNKVVSTKKTDANGYLKFENVDEGMSHSLFIDKSVKQDGIKVVNNKDQTMGTFKNDKLGFSYKLLNSDLNSMESQKTADPSGEFLFKIKARVVSVTDKVTPVADQVVQLKDMQNKVLQTKTTNQDGDFEFSDVDVKEIYSVELFEYKEKFKSEKLYISNSKNELIAKINKDKNGNFSYKTIPADMIYLADLPQEDITLTVKKQLKLSEKNIMIRDFVFYELNSATLSSDAKMTLDKIALIIEENPGSKVDVISHTDCKGENDVNSKLSQKRSEAVTDYFIKRGIPKERLNPVGMGESTPLNSCADGVNCTEAELRMNRRTEFKFYK